MGSGLSKMYDDYEDYEYICKNLGESTVGFTKFLDDWGKGYNRHEEEILAKHGFKRKYDYFEFLRKQEDRDKKLKKVLGNS